MGDFWKELLARMPDWSYHAFAVMVILGLGGLFWWFTLGAKRFSDVMSRENRVIELQEELTSLREESRKHEGVSYQLLRALENMQVYIRTLNDIKVSGVGRDTGSHYVDLLQRIIEAIASDVKQRAGERHRCGFWLKNENENELILIHASSGFPSHYLSNRRLSVERSLAGKAFRRKEIIKMDNVEDDGDWQPNPQSNSPYKALICVPIGDVGVVTLDALYPIEEHAKIVCEAYCQIINSVMQEYIISIAARSIAEQQIASADDSENLTGGDRYV